jgi:uncharacterized protein (DUF302 family)
MSDAAGVQIGFGTTVSGAFDDVVARVVEAFKAQGFGTLTRIDVQKTLKEKIGEEIEPYTILGMCNPHLASQSIRIVHEMGLMLPCNVLVHECGGSVHVSVQDPELMFTVLQNDALKPIAEEAKRRLSAALQSLVA